MDRAPSNSPRRCRSTAKAKACSIVKLGMIYGVEVLILESIERIRLTRFNNLLQQQFSLASRLYAQ